MSEREREMSKVGWDTQEGYKYQVLTEVAKELKPRGYHSQERALTELFQDKILIIKGIT